MEMPWYGSSPDDGHVDDIDVETLQQVKTIHIGCKVTFSQTPACHSLADLGSAH